MRALIQRVSSAKVRVDSQIIGEIDFGLLTLLGIHATDREADVQWLIQKILALRIFEDSSGKMNRAVKEVGGSHLIVSQFTLYADVQSGNRPSFTEAAKPEIALPLYEKALEVSRAHGIKTAGGRFQAHMQVELCNDGPVTIMIETPKKSP